MVGSIRKLSLALAPHLTVHRSCDSAEMACNSDGAGHGGPAPLTLFALTLRGNRRRDGNPAILCETAEAE